jgi:hypothetical protein
MTPGTVVKVVSTVSFVILLAVFPFQFFVVRQVPIPLVRTLMLVVFAISFTALVAVVVSAPRAVRLDATKLSIERLALGDVVVPLRDITGVEAGPFLSMLGSDVRRVVGNGGFLGFTGLYHVKNVGLVRCWATRLEEPTVLVRRGSERPLLLGVDDAAGLLQALQTRVGSSPSTRGV